MSMACTRPPAARTAPARATMARAAATSCSRVQPWEPTWQCRPVSQGRAAKAATICPRHWSRGRPNLEKAPATEVAAMAPAPTWGLTRRPTVPRGAPASATAASMRSSSWKLSALRCTPRARARRISATVLAGESKTMRPGGSPASRASSSSGSEATSAPRAGSSSARRCNSGGRGLALTATACRVPGGKAATASRARAARRSRSWITRAVSSEPTWPPCRARASMAAASGGVMRVCMPRA